MKLSGSQFEHLQEALLDAYTEFGLRQMLRMQMDVDLDQVAGGDNLREIVFNLGQWAERQGQVQRLIEAAQAGNQKNPGLVSLAAEAQGWFLEPSASPEPRDEVVPTKMRAAHEVFLSYSRKDSEPMQVVHRALSDAGLTVWTDAGLVVGTHSWQSEIRAAIDAAQHVVVLMSPDANLSRWVNIEVNYALESGKPIFPLLIRGQRKDSILFSLFDSQHIDAREDLYAASEQLSAALRDRSKKPQLDRSVAHATTVGPSLTESNDSFVGPNNTRTKGSRLSHLTQRTALVIAGAIALVVIAFSLSKFDTSWVEDRLSWMMGSNGVDTPDIGEFAVEPVRMFADIPFAYIPEGEFIMGSADEDPLATEDEKPQRLDVFLDAYWIMQTEVTNEMWRRFLEADGYARESYWSDAGWHWRIDNSILEPEFQDDAEFSRPEQPVVGVSWYEAEAFANWLSAESGREMSLPTEAQWEKACRGTDGHIYPWQDDSPPDESRLNYDQQVEITTDVGSYPAGANGLYDMAGNAWEWTKDWYEEKYRLNASAENSEQLEDDQPRALRGGSFDYGAELVRCANRDSNEPGSRFNDVGFRLISPAQ